MFRLMETRDVLPKSLFITDITMTNAEAIGTVCIGQSAFRGEHKGKQVLLRAVKVPDDVRTLQFSSPHSTNLHDKDTLKKELYMQALEWNAHHFVLPLLGIFEDNSHLFIVSPLMVNGTITEWRRSQKPDPDVKEIHSLVMFRRLSEEFNGTTYVC